MNICIIGENGAGKTTFVKELLGIKQNEEQQNIEVQANIIFQNPENNIIEYIVYDDISFGLINRGLDYNEIKEKVEDISIQLGIYELLDKMVSTLSGGETQRVAIAGAVVTKPEFIVFDEVTSMLDPLNRKKVLNLIHQLNSSGITTISITHDYEEALSAQKIIYMKKRKIKKFDRPLKVFKELEQKHREYLPVRYQLCAYISECADIPMEDLLRKNIKELVGILWEFHFQK